MIKGEFNYVYSIIINLIIISSNVQCYTLNDVNVDNSNILINKINNDHHFNFTTADSLKFLLKQGEIMKNYMDYSVDPCDNFYEFACGNWDKYHPIPHDSSEHNVFSILNENIQNTLKELLSAKSTKNTTQFEQKAKLFYLSCIDSKKINERSTQPLLDLLNDLGGWPATDPNWNPDKFNLIDVLVKQAYYDHKSVFSVSISIDLTMVSKYGIYVEGPQFGLNNREEYLNKENQTHLTAYKKLIISTLNLLDVDMKIAENVANEIIKIECDLTNFTVPYGYDLELSELYKPTTLEELIENYPNFNWKHYLNSIFKVDLELNKKIGIFMVTDLKAYVDYVTKLDNKTLANYVIWQSVRNVIDLLDDRFAKISQEFDSALTGIKEPELKWKECVKRTNSDLGWITAGMYTKAVGFDDSVRQDVKQLTEELIDELYSTMLEADWLDKETKHEAELKINKTTLAVGYPDFIVNNTELEKYYNTLSIDPGKFFDNVMNVAKLEKHRDYVIYMNKTVELEWPLPPAVANAFFEQNRLRIVMPSGILQPPIYHKNYPRALKYGAVGAFIGHELTHGVDVTGREFDHNGNLRNWWKNESVQHFFEKTKCFVDQYSKFSLYGKHLNGEASRGENIADNGGLRQAFNIYKKWLSKANPIEISEENMLNLSLTNEQLFFLGFAQSWCGSIRPEGINHRVNTDYHCPGRFRIIGTLQNFNEFSKAYNCSKNSYMNPIVKCRLW